MAGHEDASKRLKSIMQLYHPVCVSWLLHTRTFGMDRPRSEDCVSLHDEVSGQSSTKGHMLRQSLVSNDTVSHMRQNKILVDWCRICSALDRQQP